MNTSIKNRKRCPSHPGQILRNLYLQPLAISITELSQTIGASRKAISAIVNGRKAITPDMALRLSEAFPNSTAESWLNLQKNYDLWQAVNKSDIWRKIKPIITNNENQQNKSEKNYAY